MGSKWFDKIFNDTMEAAYDKTLVAYGGCDNISLEEIRRTYMVYLMILAQEKINADRNAGDRENKARLIEEYGDYIEGRENEGSLDSKVDEIRRIIGDGFDVMEVQLEGDLPNQRIYNGNVGFFDMGAAAGERVML